MNNIPLLVFPSDSYASRQPDPVLQQIEQSNSLAVTTNDAFKPVVKYWDRIQRPEQLMSALINAMRVLTDPAETGAVAIALPQDVEGESYDYPESFFAKRVHRITRPAAVDEELRDVAEVIKASRKPIVIGGGGVRYSEAGEIEAAKQEWDDELGRLGGIVCDGPEFEPIIKARDERTIPEFVKRFGTSLTQTAALAALRAVMEPGDNIVCAGGSLPSDLQRVWKTDKRGGYHVEYGYSCMGCEIGASMGVRMADPDNEEYTVVGDAGFQMLSSELGTIMQERVKTNILVFDNCGFGCINNLEMTHGIGSLATEFRYTDGKKPVGDLVRTDYAKIGEAYGMKSYTCKSVEELTNALKDSKRQKVACLFDLKVVPKTMTDGYGAWWNVGIATTSEKESVREACREVMEHRDQARKY